MNKRDIQLLISAKDNSSTTFQNVATSVGNLAKRIDEQAAAASRGEISMAELKNTTRELEQAGRELSNQQGGIDLYKRLETQLQANKEKAAEYRTEQAQLNAQVEESGEATGRQAQRLERLESLLTSTSAAIQQNETALKAQSASLKAAGLAADDLGGSQAQIVNTAKQIGQASQVASASIQGLAGNVRAAKDAEAALAAENAFQQKIIDAERLGESARYVSFWANALDEADRAEEKLKAQQGLDAFRAVGQNALEASKEIDRYVESARSGVTQSERFADGLQALINPGKAAVQSLDGIENKLDEIDAASQKSSKQIAEYGQDINELRQISSEIVRQGGLVDAFQQQEQAVGSARKEYANAKTDVERYAKAVDSATKEDRELAQALDQSQNELKQTSAALAEEERRLAALERQLESSKIDTNNLTGEMDRLAAGAQRTGKALGEAQARAKGKGGFLGLNPFDLQNLQFQITDIVQGLASGQKPLQVFVQQGGQLFDILKKVGPQLLNMLLRFFPLIAAVTAVGFVLKAVYDDFKRLDEVTQVLNSRPLTGGVFDAAQLASTRKNLEDMGASAEDAQGALVQLVDAGVQPDKLDELARAAQNLAEAYGTELTEAVDLLVNAQNGGIEAAEELAEATDVLTVADLGYAEQLFESGQAVEARDFILGKAQSRLQDIADSSRGPWRVALDNITDGFVNIGRAAANDIPILRDLLNLVQSYNNFIVNGFGRGISGIGSFFKGEGFLKGINDFNKAQRGPSPADQAEARAESQRKENRRQQQYLDGLEEEGRKNDELTASKRRQLATDQARAKAQSAGLSKANEEKAVAIALREVNQDISKDAAKSAKSSNSAANKRKREAARQAREAAKLERQIDRLNDKLNNGVLKIDTRVARGDIESIESRVANVQAEYQKVLDTIQELQEKGETLSETGESLEQIKARVVAAREAVKLEEELAFFEEKIARLAEERDKAVERINENLVAGATDSRSAYEDVETITRDINTQIAEAAAEALQLAKAVGGATPNPELKALIKDLQQVIDNGASGVLNPQDEQSAATARLGFDLADADLNRVLRERNDLVQTYVDLEASGIINAKEARNQTERAFNAAKADVMAYADELERAARILFEIGEENGGISAQAFQAITNEVSLLRQEAEFVDARIASINQTAQQSLANGIVQATNIGVQALVNFIGRAKTAGEALQDIFYGLLDLVGQFINALAQALLQMFAIEAAKAIIGSGTGGLGGLFFHSGGVVGRGSGRRVGGDASPLTWAMAPRFHSGGGAGLGPDEYRAVLKKNEEVLTGDDPRNILNGGGQGGGKGQAPSLRQVLVIGEDQIAGAMAGKAGEKTMLTFVKTNAATIKQILK